ncbi:hypothetical protein EV677_2940 [Herminiimonas fonticola]|uniref:Uncharacterized protein n=1 Tax=Herminiimonas fonticola TaxID=303380 RepID=A0A4R6G071_9BURK|nr:hypothetical protein Hfont_2935 [Herminiimonas fonticola]TDN87683.1 hypothetical protein EV677_2940 [Herminiimonas fonticola]
MLYTLSWFVVLSIFVLWSLAAWAFHSVALWAVSSAGTFTSTTSASASLRLPEGLALWVPSEIVQAMTSLLSGLAPVVEGLLHAAPALVSSLTVATWVIWGLGSALLFFLGAGAHRLISIWGRYSDGSRTPTHAKGIR